MYISICSMNTNLHYFKFGNAVITTFLYMYLVQPLIFFLVFFTGFFFSFLLWIRIFENCIEKNITLSEKLTHRNIFAFEHTLNFLFHN